MNTFFAIKQEMSQRFVDGVRTPVTVLKAEPNVVTYIKNKGRDGYEATQLGAGSRALKSVSKALQGHLKTKKGAKTAPRFLREVPGKSEKATGDQVSVQDVFSPGDTVTVSGDSKGKGFAGVVKRWSFAGGPATHGQSDRERAPGSIGQGTTPGRVFKGKKMAGRMGGSRITVKNLKIVAVDNDKSLLEVSGAIPGSRGTLVRVTKTAEAEKAPKKSDEG